MIALYFHIQFSNNSFTDVELLCVAVFGLFEHSLQSRYFDTQLAKLVHGIKCLWNGYR